MSQKLKEKEQIQALLSGDESDFQIFFNEYFPRIYRFAIDRVSGDTQIAGEVVQNTLTKVLHNISRFRGESSLFSWICSICMNEIRDYRKSEARFGRTITLQGSTLDLAAIPNTEFQAVPEHPDEAYDREQRTLLIHRILDMLPMNYGNLIEWKYIEGLSVEQIADRLGVGKSAAQSMLYRARMAFQDLHRKFHDSASRNVDEGQ